MENQKILIAIIDDHEQVRESIKILLDSMGANCETFGGVEEFTTYQDIKKYNVIISDLRLGDGNGIEIIKYLKQNDFNTPIILLSAYINAKYFYEAITLGVKKILDKPCADQELWDAVLSCIKEETVESQDEQMKAYSGNMEKLTELELQTLQALIKGQNPKQIAFTDSVSVRAIEKRRENILKKLNANSLSHVCIILNKIGRLDEFY